MPMHNSVEQLDCNILTALLNPILSAELFQNRGAPA